MMKTFLTIQKKIIHYYISKKYDIKYKAKELIDFYYQITEKVY